MWYEVLNTHLQHHHHLYVRTCMRKCVRKQGNFVISYPLLNQILKKLLVPFFFFFLASFLFFFLHRFYFFSHTSSRKSEEKVLERKKKKAK